MTNSSASAPMPEAIRVEARSWVAALADPDVSDDERRDFDRWLAEDERHGEAYKTSLQAYDLIGDASVRLPSPARSPLGAARRAPYLLGAGLALAASLAIALLMPQAPAPVRPDFSTERAEVRRVDLADGSTITLGAATQMEVNFTTSERRVRIGDGEAYFEVSHDSARPFFVETTGGAVVRVIGTAFDLKASRDLVRVSVARGVVEVTQPRRFARLIEGDVHRLTAGEAVVIERNGTTPIAVTSLPRPPVSWRDGFLTYDNATLGEVVADANRYSPTPIRLANQRLAQLRVTGSYPTDQIEQMLEGLDGGLPVDLERQPNEIIITSTDGE